MGLAHPFGTRAAQIDAGEILQVRLTSRVCSHSSQVGDRVTAVVLGRAGTGVDDPLAGAELSGSVAESHRVGIGIKHARARLRLQFDTVRFANSPPVEITSRVAGVDNARETVDPSGRIQGIEAGDGPASFINNRWIHLPSFTSFSVYTNVSIMAYKFVTPFFPDPEIHYPAGTEMSVVVTQQVMVPEPQTLRSGFAGERSEELERVAGAMAVRTHRNGKKRPADIVNLMFVGSEKNLSQAFRMAGWVKSKRLSFATASHELAAIFEKRYYDETPVSNQTLEGETPAMVWQKGLNDQTKRHHARIWKMKENHQGAEVWAAAATHDVGVGMRLKSFELYHHIATDIDTERTKVVRDLIATGCVESVRWVERPWVPSKAMNSTGDEMTSDARVAVVGLGPCRAESALAPIVVAEPTVKHGSFLARYLRKDILTVRYDVFKANILYGSYQLGSLAWHAARHSGVHETLDARRPAAPDNGLASAFLPTR